jgi:hypothetical protein
MISRSVRRPVLAIQKQLCAIGQETLVTAADVADIKAWGVDVLRCASPI